MSWPRLPADPNTAFKLLTLAVMAVLVVPGMFQEGLFMDGIMYSALANNLAHNEGTFWQPVFHGLSEASFHEHPPLVFWLQSIFFRILGDGFWVEKVYSALMAVLTAVLIVKLWKSVQKGTPRAAMYWLPLLLWFTVDRVYWSYGNNMLENTMGLFPLAAILVLLTTEKRKGVWRIMMYLSAGVLLCLGFLCKGFPALYPLAFPVCYQLAFRRKDWFRPALRDSALLLLVFSGTVGLLLVTVPGAAGNLAAYLQKQVVTSVSGDARVGSRLMFLLGSLEQLLPMLAVCALVFGLTFRKSKARLAKTSEEGSTILLFLLIGFSASLPLTVSPKLSLFYLVPAIPYFGLAAALFLAVPVQAWLERMHPRVRTVVAVVGIASLAGTLGYGLGHFGAPYRDEEMLADLEAIARLVPAGAVITVSEGMQAQYSTLAYLQRRHRLLPTRSMSGAYCLALPGEGVETVWTSVEAPFRTLRLYRAGVCG